MVKKIRFWILTKIFGAQTMAISKGPNCEYVLVLKL